MTDFAIFHNIAQDELGRSPALLRGYKPGDPMVEVFRWTEDNLVMPATDGRAADRAFFMFNVGHQPEMNAGGQPNPVALEYRGRHLRSLSVGDIVVIDGRAHAVESFGFQPVAALDNVTDQVPATVHGTVAWAINHNDGEGQE